MHGEKVSVSSILLKIAFRGASRFTSRIYSDTFNNNFVAALTRRVFNPARYIRARDGIYPSWPYEGKLQSRNSFHVRTTYGIR